MHVMVTALRGALKFLTAPAWAGFVLAPQGALATATTDAELAAYARSLTSSVWHPFGTAAMSPAGAKTGVTDPDLRVKNVSGLRIVDASIFVSAPAVSCARGFGAHAATAAVRPRRAYAGPRVHYRGARSRYHQSRLGIIT